MPIKSGLRYLHLAYLSHPAENRPLYRAIRRNRIRRIVEIGVGSVERAVRMIRLASQIDSPIKVRYTGLDRFELRQPEHGEPLSLKQAHRDLRSTGAQVQLVPGNPAQSLTRVANSLMNTDLVLIGAEEGAMVTEQAGFYLPRLLHGGSLVFEERRDASDAVSIWRRLTPLEIESRVRHRWRPSQRAA